MTKMTIENTTAVAPAHEVRERLKALESMSTDELRCEYARLFGEATFSRNRTYLLKRVAWLIQRDAFGDISEKARKRAEELAAGSSLRVRARRVPPLRESRTEAVSMKLERQHERDPRLPLPGAVIVREFKEQEIRVTVLNDGFLYKEKHYKSLSAIAREVTGTNWNGFIFFFGKKEGVA